MHGGDRAGVQPAGCRTGTGGDDRPGPKSSLWGALNVLDMPELYRVLQEADRKGRLSAIAAKTNKAEGVDNNRLFAPMDAIFLKKENLSQTPDRLRQWLLPLC
jgi:hypothetical protein